MRKFPIFILTFWLFSTTAFAQKAALYDNFGKVTCDDFMARMDAIFIELQNSPDSKIYVVYYGGRFRKESSWNEKTKSFDKIKLEYPHPEDGLNWAKSIPLYLTTYCNYPIAIRNLLNDKIVLFDGGFRENTEVEIWFVPKDSGLSEPTPTVAEKDIKFRKDKPSRTPNFTSCYGYC
jgi:hypothetical protein